MRHNTILEIIVAIVLIVAASLGAVALAGKIREDAGRRVSLDRMEARLDSLTARYARDSIAVEEFRVRWDSLAATADTILQLRK